jgi:hypothetical protein
MSAPRRAAKSFVLSLALALAWTSLGSISAAEAAVGNVSKDWTPEKMSADTDDGVLLRKLKSLFQPSQIRAIEGYGVVQVITRPGTIVASGTVVFLDQEPVVLTNSHVLSGREAAEVEFPLFHFSVPAKRLLDVPAADLALLRLEIPQSGSESQKWLYAHAAAFMNMRFCTPKDSSCENGLQYFFGYERSSEAQVLCAVVDARPVCTKNTAPWTALSVPDTVASGIYDHMIKIPTFARPGMSGGAFYKGGRLGGILAKVDLGLGSFGYAIPIDEAARVIRQKHFGVPAGILIPEGKWIGDANSPLLQIQLAGDVILSSPRSGASVSAGGEAGNSGGEAGNSGGEAGNSGGHPALQRYWKLLIRMFKAEQIVRASNPFFAKPHDLLVNGRKLLAIELPKEQQPENRILLAPSIPAYLWARLNGSGPNGFSWKPIWDSPENRRSLIERRRLAFIKPRFARIYVREADVFIQEGGSGDTHDESGAFNLLKHHGFSPYRLQPSDLDSFLTVTVNRSREPLAIRVDRSLDEVLIFNGTATASAKLRRVTPLEAPTLLYCLEDTKTGRCNTRHPYRVSMSWSRFDLGRLDRILVTTPNYIHEFVACSLGNLGDCVR